VVLEQRVAVLVTTEAVMAEPILVAVAERQIELYFLEALVVQELL
jgi:hypothetical protein